MFLAYFLCNPWWINRLVSGTSSPATKHLLPNDARINSWNWNLFPGDARFDRRGLWLYISSFAGHSLVTSPGHTILNLSTSKQKNQIVSTCALHLPFIISVISLSHHLILDKMNYQVQRTDWWVASSSWSWWQKCQPRAEPIRQKTMPWQTQSVIWL